MKGYIYLLKSAYGYKIGKSKNPKNRNNFFGVKLPFEVEMIKTIQIENYHQVEKDLHKHFENKHLNGEWFDLTEEEVEEFEQITNQYDLAIQFKNDTSPVNLFFKEKKNTYNAKFIQVYLEDISIIMDLKDASSIKVLLNLCKYCTYNTNEIIIVKALKERIAENTGIKLQTVSNIISNLVKKDILIKRARSIYFLNPFYFFKGRDFNRQKLIRLIVEYELIDVEKEGVKGMMTDSDIQEYYAYLEKKEKEKR